MPATDANRENVGSNLTQMMTKRLIIILTATLAINLTYAQSKTDSLQYKRLTKFPVFSTNYFNYSSSEFDINNQKGKIEMDEWTTMLEFAFPIKEKKWYLSNRVQYTYFTFEATTELTNFKASKDFHSIAYSIGIIKILPKRWKLVASFTPTLASDFEESLHSDDFIFQAAALAMKRSSQNFEYGFGVAYTTRFGNATLIPLVNLTYKVNNWETLVILPAYISQNYLFNKNTKLGGKLAVYGNLYNAVFSNTTSNIDLNRVSYSRITIGPDFQTKLFGDFHLNVGAGIAMRNILEFQDDDLNSELDFSTDNKFFFNIGIKLLK